MLVWTFVPEHVYVFMRGGRRHESLCLRACICESMSVQTYGLTSMQTLQRAARWDQCAGSKCQTLLTETVHSYHVPLQMSKKKSVLCLESSHKNTVGSSLCQVETKSIMEFKAKNLIKDQLLTDSLCCTKVRMQQRRR